MHQVITSGLHLWQFDLLNNVPGQKHFVTDKMANGKLPIFTLSYSSSPDKQGIRRNRNLLSSALGVPDNQLFIPSQVHMDRIVNVGKATSKEELLETDGLITNEPGVCIAVLAADCVPIILYDKKNRAIAAIHSGWRGTVAKILEKALLKMHQDFGTEGQDLIACIGPSICLESYEVGEDVARQFYNVFGMDSGVVEPQPGNKAKVDLWKANKLQLLEFGVLEAQ
ncbi:MAG: peptidoglycan editing factor PgeF [Bacteroidota bacterium]|nr:peptidoglycan editing factor PgeF [Bacteroidota bacterium]